MQLELKYQCKGGLGKVVCSARQDIAGQDVGGEEGKRLLKGEGSGIQLKSDPETPGRLTALGPSRSHGS